MSPDDRAADFTGDGRKLETQVTKDYHRVEKGLALRAPKRPFGGSVTERLERLVPQLPAESEVAGHARTAQAALEEWNRSGTIDSRVSPVRESSDRGISSAQNFFSSRHSVRDFHEGPVDKSTVERAVELAINSPSVCNRQPWKVRLYTDPATTNRALEHQNGNSGFRDCVPVVALVSVDSRLFAGPSERNQGWIEGGIFSMSFVWALHSLGLDTCMLNLSLATKQMNLLRADLQLKSHELPIMMIAIGHGRPGHRRARSPRRGVSDVAVQTPETE